MTSFVWRSSDRRSDVCFSDLLLLSQSAQIRLKNIRFEGNRALYLNGTAVRFAKTANTDDMAAMVDDCEFEGLHICVDHVGRGLYLRRNIIALSDIGANFSWPDSGVEGTGLHQLPYGYRKWMLVGNHFHSIGLELKNSDAEPMRGVRIAEKLLDIGRKLWEGPIINSLLASNVCENLSSVGIEITGDRKSTRLNSS